MKKSILKKSAYLILFALLAFSFSGVISFAHAAVNIPKTSRQTIHGRILDSQGHPLVAQVQVWYEPITDVVPAFGPQKSTGRTDNLIAMTYSNENGFYDVEVPADTILLIITRGPEWELIHKVFVIGRNQFDGLQYNVRLKQLYNLKKLGWYGGDPHSHTLHSDGYQYPSALAKAMQAVGLSWGILTDHNSISGGEEWHSTKSGHFLPILGNEISTEASDKAAENGYGHMNQTFITTLNGTYPDDANIWARAVFDGQEDVQRMIDLTHGQGGIITINHPFQSWDWAGRFKSWGLVKDFDAIEVWNGDPPHSLTTSTWDSSKININTWAVQAWFEYLNAGNRMAALAGSDGHDIYGTQAYPKGKFYWTTTIGNPRTYTRCRKLNKQNLEKSLKNGQSFLTSGFGPLLLIKAGKKAPGEVVKVGEDGVLKLKCEVLANQPLLKTGDGIRIIVNGQIVKRLATGTGLTFKTDVPLKIMKDSWIVAEAFGKWPMYAVTNAIYVDYPPYGDWENPVWQNPVHAEEWNKFKAHPAITIPDGPSSWKDSE